MQYQSVAAGADTAGRWAVIALGLSIPIAVALDNVLLGAIALMWLAADGFRHKFSIIRANPVALAALALFGLLVLGLAYGSRNAGDGLHYLGKYADLLFVPVFLTLFQDQRTRERGLLAFGIAIALTLIVSHLAYMNLLVDNPLLLRTRSYPVGFKSTITQSLLVGYAAFLFALLARGETRRAWRFTYIALALIAAHNVLFTVSSRTGYLVLAVLLLYFFVVTSGRRGVAIAFALGIVLSCAAYVGSETFYLRVNDAIAEISDWKPDKPSETSVGLRMEFYRASVQIMRERPLLGAGTGSFPAAYAATVGGKQMAETANPHNEYLLIASQIGLVGLACLIFLFCRQWLLAGRLAQPLYRDLARGLVLMLVVGCLFNSLLLDHTEGLLFAWLSGLLFAAPIKPASSPTP
jgi:O-antigen ligase